MKKKRNIVESCMHYRKIVILLVSCFVAFGIYSIDKLNKNEFPDFTIRQGMVVAAAPGLNSQEVLDQVAKPLEDYIYTYKEVNKNKTTTKCRDGIVYIQVELNDDVKDKDEFWSKFKHGVDSFKSSLPRNVLAIVTMDDFGDSSALLITMESEDKTYRELNDYMDELTSRLRKIESVGRLVVNGEKREQISVVLDNNRLAHYGLNDKLIAMNLLQKGFHTTGGTLKLNGVNMPIYVSHSINSLKDVQEQIVWSDTNGNVLRLKDIAEVKKEYPISDSSISNTITKANGGTGKSKKCILLSLEMKPGNNIVAMGREVDKVLEEYQQTVPSDVNFYRITDQSELVKESVTSFLGELLIAIVAVVIVVMLLLPIKVALVAASTIPITVFISMGIFRLIGIELNTVTLAALIVVLGMIVDNSIVIIDNYLEQISEGKPRWQASIDSATHFFKSIFSATLAISVTFFPFLFVTTGMLHDFLMMFPWGVTIVLMVSLAVAATLVPIMQYYFIKEPLKSNEKKGFNFMNLVQGLYNKLLDLVFAWPKTTLFIGFASVVIGVVLFKFIPQSMMPTADRNQFAVEITLPLGSTIEETSAISDSLENILKQDERVLSITAFKGCSSPRFMNAYAPQIAGSNFAQFIVNTISPRATIEVLDEYAPKYSDYYSNARVRFKQLSYSEAVYPIEVRLSNSNMDSLRRDVAKVKDLLMTLPELKQVKTDFLEAQPTVKVKIKEEEAQRLQVDNMAIEMALAMRYSSGLPLSNAWEGNYNIPVVIKSNRADSSSIETVKDEKIPLLGGVGYVPLRQVASVEPTWTDGQICTRNGVPTMSVVADIQRGLNSIAVTETVHKALEKNISNLSSNIVFGGDKEKGDEMSGMLVSGLCIAIAIIIIILIWHFRRLSETLLIFASMSLCIFGAVLGGLIQGLDFGATCFLGIISLIGILVRNAIIMFDYAEELRSEYETMPLYNDRKRSIVRDAIYTSAKRRMRPIFLTSAAASMGVIPMIIGGSGLWKPMGAVIFWGTLITMLFILTVLPVMYWYVQRGSSKKRIMQQKFENE